MSINNTQSPVANIVKSVMSATAQEGARQAELTIALFDSEVTITASSIEALARKEGAERTTAIDKIIGQFSDEYVDILDTYEELTDKELQKERKLTKEQKRVSALEAESTRNKIRAVRVMFQRALDSVYYLRVNKCTKVKLYTVRKGSLVVYMPDEDGDTVKSEMSGRELQSKGATLVRTAIGKATKPAITRNPAGSSMVDASKALAAALTVNNDKLLEAIEGDGELATNLNVTFKQLFAAHFADDKGHIDMKAISEYVTQTFKPAAPSKKVA